MSLARITQLLEEGPPGDVTKHVYQLISSDGKGGGTYNLNQNAAADYYFVPDQKERVCLQRLNVWETDLAFSDATKYGAGNALTNGISITVENAEGIIKNYTPITIKTTYEWALLSGVDSTSLGGAGTDPHLVRWTFSKGGGNIMLDGSKGEFLKVSYGDAMDFMTSIRIMVQGYKC